MVSLIEHAHEPHVPPDTALLIAGSVALGLVSLVIVSSTLDDARRLPQVYRPVGVAMVAGAVVALVVGWLAPAPWVLALLLALILTVLWLVVVGLFLRANAWSEEQAAAEIEAAGEAV
jgi:hypothetical protein